MSGRAWRAWLDESERLLDLLTAHGVSGLDLGTKQRLKAWAELGDLLGMKAFSGLGRRVVDEALPLDQRAVACLDWVCRHTALVALDQMADSGAIEN